MTRIAYDYIRDSSDPHQPNISYQGVQAFDYFFPSATAISRERNGDTLDPVSTFTVSDVGGTRTERNGLGAIRYFYFGGSPYRNSPNPGTYHCRGFELAKLTDFTSTGTNIPFVAQNYFYGVPAELWDAKGTYTQFTLQTGPYGGDGTGRIQQVHQTGADGSSVYYDRVNAGNSAAQDFTRLPNPFHHWLFRETDENNNTTIYTRDGLRRVTHIDYPDGASENFGYDDRFNTVTYHQLPSGTAEHFDYDGRGRLNWEYNESDGWEARKEYTYDEMDRVQTMTDGLARDHGAPYTVMMRYNGRNDKTEVHYPPTPNGGSADPYMKYEYDPYGNCTGIWNELADKNNPAKKSRYAYDDYRRCTEFEEPLDAPNWNGSGWQGSRKWNWSYDRYLPSGVMFPASTHTSKQWRVQVEPAYNAAGDRALSAHKFDAEDRITEEQTGLYESGADGSWHAGLDTETHQYTCDANGNKETYLDPQSRLTTYRYDLRNRLKTTTEPLNRVTENWYDAAGNKTQVQFPDTRTQQWQVFDAFGQPRIFIDERNQTTHLDYWPWGPMKKLAQVTTHRATDGGGTEDQHTLFYFTGMGRPFQTTFPDGSTEQTSYHNGQVLTWKTRKEATKTVSYDARARESGHTWDDGQTPNVSQLWDDAGRLAHIENKFSVIDFTYDAAAEVRSETDLVTGTSPVTTNYWRYQN